MYTSFREAEQVLDWQARTGKELYGRDYEDMRKEMTRKNAEEEEEETRAKKEKIKPQPSKFKAARRKLSKLVRQTRSSKKPKEGEKKEKKNPAFTNWRERKEDSE